MMCDGDKPIIANDCETVSTSMSTLTTNTSFPDPDSNVQNIRVVARIRPLSTKELDENCKESLTAAEALRTIVVDKTKKFEYDAVFGPESTQSSVYEKTAGDMIRNNLFKGFNVTVLAYGQTGSGKTHTVFGTSTISHEGPLNAIDGIIPRAIYDVFNFIGEMDNGAQRVKVEMSYLEIYNEEAKDLLTDDPNPPDLHIRENKTEGVVVQNLSRHIVSSRKNIADLMESAWGRRATASTAMNEVSSRSHAICTIHIAISPPLASDGTESICEDKINAKLTLVDLAGSERVKKTGAEGARLKEGININKGLFVLGQVVSALAEIEQQSGSSESSSIHVKYRDSKLTRLLQDSLGGNSKTVMVACISPSDSNIEESVNTLRYAERTRNIRTSAVRNVVAVTMSASEAAALRKENQMLKLHLFQAQTKLSSRIAAPVNMLICDSQKVSQSHLDDGIENETNGLDMKKLDMITKLRLHCSSMKENIDQLEDKAQSTVEDSLLAALRADKWQLKCEELMTSMKSHGVPYPDSLKNEGRFQSLHMVSEMRKEISEQKNELRDAKIDAEVSRATAAALLNGNGDEAIVEKMDFSESLNSTKYDTIEADQKGSDEKLTAELVAMSEAIDQKEVMFRKVSQEKHCMDEMRSHFELAIKSLQEEVEVLTSEREQILVKVQKTSSPKSDTISTKMRQRITHLESRIKELRLTHAEHSRSLKLQESAKRRCEKLETEIKADKKRRCALQRKLKEESESRRSEKKAAKLQASKLLRDSQRLKYELNKVKEAAARQAAVLRRKATDAISKQKQLAKKRSHPTTITSSHLTGERKEELTNWLDREITSALCLKELRAKIEGHQEILEDTETRKQQLASQNLSDETIATFLRNISVEIEMRSDIIDQLEKNADEIFKVANKNPRAGKKPSTCLLEPSFWQSLSRAEISYVFNEFFISMIDEKYQYTSQKECHDALLNTEVRRAVDVQKRHHEKMIVSLNIQHSSTITDLLESTKATIQADIGDKLKNKSSQDTGMDEDSKKLVDQMLNRYIKSCTKISDSVRTDLNSIKATQDSMKTIVDDVVVGLISHNVANAVLMSKKKKKKKTVPEEESIDLSEFENDNDETILEDSDDSDWSPDTPTRPKKRIQEKTSDGLPGIPIGDDPSLEEENFEKMTCLELRSRLRECNQIVSGRKAELIARLKDCKKAGVISIDPADDTEEMKKEKTSEKEVENENTNLKLGKKRIASTKEDKVGNRLNKKLRSSNDSYESASSTISSKRRVVSTKDDNASNRSKKKLRSSGDSSDSASSIDSIKQKFSAGRKNITSKFSAGTKRGATQSSNRNTKRLTSARKITNSSNVENVSISGQSSASESKIVQHRRRTPPTPARNSRIEVSSKRNGVVDTRLAPERKLSDKDAPTIRNPSSQVSSQVVVKHPIVTSLDESNSDEIDDSCPHLRRSTRRVVDIPDNTEPVVHCMKENCEPTSGNQIGSAQECSTTTDPLGTITNSAIKRKRNRRQSMAKSVNRAMKALEEITI